MVIELKRVYDPPADDDGLRILVDRLWPRGLSKKQAHIDYWPKEIAPSDEVRKWYQHDPKKWKEFKKRYFKELEQHDIQVAELKALIGTRHATFLFATSELSYNNAVALKEYLEKHV